MATSGERRHLTVLFCDLVGSTEIAALLDPEEWREVVSAYHGAVAEAITRYGGHVGKYLGDGVMAYFGWPTAHDNDAERAARAGLAILEAILKLNHDATRPKLAARVGIDSGSVVVGAGANQDVEVFGETPNIAARVQAAAAPNSVLITAATHRLLSGLFVVEERGAQELKGVANPVRLYRVERATGVRGRLATARGLTPFVGRAEELRLVLSRWERVREGEGQLVHIVGEAGIGKSRLVAEFHDHIRETPHIWLESAGEQFFENTPFHAITEMLSRWLELKGAANIDEQIDRIERALVSAGLKVAEVAPLITDLLHLPAGERYPTSTLTAEQKRRRLLTALSDWLLRAGTLQSLVMVVEDLHWLDPSTLEILQLLADQGATTPLLLLYTARPEFRAPWPMHMHHSQITLNRLSPRNVREMVALVASRKTLARESVEEVVERTGGVPLFVEELTRAVLESGSAGITGREIPATLHDSLMARLDRLGSAKEVIQIGAVIGSEFSYELLQAVHLVADEDLQDAIRSATDAELVYVRGIPPDATYQFKHALIRDAAYEALLKSRRKELHRQVALTVEEKFPALKEARPELLARHWTEAGQNTQAISYWKLAGKRAAERSANAEAIGHLTKGLELLTSFSESSERSGLEWELQTTLGQALMATKGFAAPEVGRAFNRALALARDFEQGIECFPALYGLFAFYVTRSELQTARELGNQLAKAVANSNDPDVLLGPHRALGQAFLQLGHPVDAREHLERGVALYTPAHHRTLALLYGRDPGVACLHYLAWALWLLGYPEQAELRNQEALGLARELQHPLSLAIALLFAGMLYRWRRDAKLAGNFAEEALKLSTKEGGFAQASAMSTALLGWAWSVQDQKQDGIELIRQGLAAYRATGGEGFRPMYLADLAEALENNGELTEALTAVREALTLANRTGERTYEAELHRLKGELTFLSSPSNLRESEFCYRTAIEVARKQSTRSWELRATTSLARLLAGQGRHDEAHSVLAAIYGWFTEGFDTADLKDAKALLNELGN